MRTEIARLDEHLTALQRRRLARADQMLIEQARRFMRPLTKSQTCVNGVTNRMRLPLTGGGTSTCWLSCPSR